MSEYLEIRQLVAVPEARVYARSEEGSRPEGQVPQQLVQGMVYAAKVVTATAEKAILEIGGGRYEVPGGEMLQPGKVLTVRVSETLPQLELELLAERTAGDKQFAAALRALFAGAGNTAESSKGLADLVGRLLNIPQQQLPEALLQALARGLTPVAVGDNSEQLEQQLRLLLANLGLGFEAELKGEALGQGTAARDSAGLKQLLQQLLLRLEGDLFSRRAENLETLSRFRMIWQELQGSMSRLIGREAAGPLAGMGRTLEGHLEAALRSADPQGGARQLRALFDFIRGELDAFTGKLGQREGAAAGREAEEIFQQLAKLLDREALFREAVRDVSKNAGDLKDRLESLQQLNVHLADRGLYQHLLFPVSILDEMTEVQVKQFISGKGKKSGGSLTAVLLLKLESLGRVRIDALLQGGALYVNVFLEKEEVVPLAEELSGEFRKHLEERGYALARFQVCADRQRIDDFQRFDLEVLAGEETIIDLQA
jgi:hypothetical protein